MALIKDSTVDRAREAGTKVRHLIDEASGEVREISTAIESRVNEKPMQSSLIALGAGFILGMLLSRR